MTRERIVTQSLTGERVRVRENSKSIVELNIHTLELQGIMKIGSSGFVVHKI